MTQPAPARRLDEFKPDARFAWCVTGSGHMIEESLELALRLPRCDLFLSRAGEEVLPLYGWPIRKLREHFKVFRDNSASSVPVGMIYHGEYHTVVIAPATSNTVAKCALGISDTLPTNLCASRQAMRAGHRFRMRYSAERHHANASRMGRSEAARHRAG